MDSLPESFVDEVRSAADILAVVSDYISLFESGSIYQGECPFDGGEGAWFCVNRDRGRFHCFRCGKNGDVFAFVALKENVTFADAVRRIAQRFGVKMPGRGVGRD